MKLAEWLEEQGMNPHKFADYIEEQPSLIYKLVKGERTCSPRLAQKIERLTFGKVTRIELVWPDYVPKRPFEDQLVEE